MSTVQVDTINESTTDSGVTVDGVLIKDGGIQGASGIPLQVVTYQNIITGSNTITSTSFTAVSYTHLTLPTKRIV